MLDSDLENDESEYVDNEVVLSSLDELLDELLDDSEELEDLVSQ